MLADILIQIGANVNASDNNGVTPLLLAAFKGILIYSVEGTKRPILLCVLNIAKFQHHLSSSRFSFLCYEHVVEILIEKGANTISAERVHGYTPLHAAALNGKEAESLIQTLYMAKTTRKIQVYIPRHLTDRLQFKKSTGKKSNSNTPVSERNT